MTEIYKEGTPAKYKNTITNIEADCVVAKDVKKDSNVIPVNIYNSKGEIEHKNAWVSKDNLTF